MKEEIIMCKLLNGKTAIVTGAKGGIGKAVCELFAENGATIYACARGTDSEFEEWVDLLGKRFSTAIIPVYFDLCNKDEVRDAMKHIFKHSNCLDILVNNAGIASAGTLRMVSQETLQKVFETNFFAPVIMMQYAAGKMIRQKKGSIINIASVGGIEAQPGYLAYGASKASLIWATRCIAKELGQYNIRVNAVAPGLTNTNMGHYTSDNEREKKIQRTSLHRMASPKEIANAVLFLASDNASYIVGEVMRVDGGRG